MGSTCFHLGAFLQLIGSLSNLDLPEKDLAESSNTKRIILVVTPQKIEIEPENDGLEDDFPFPGVYSQVPS